MKTRLTLLLLVVVAVGNTPDACATTLQRMSIEDLVAATPAIARVRCVSSEARWDRGRIWTFTSLELVESLKGAVPQRFTVRLPGGKAGSLLAKVDGVPRFAPGEEAVLFLQPTSAGDWGVVSWVQGTFRIRREKSGGEERVTQDTGEAALFNPTTRKFEPGGIRNLPLRGFRERVDHAIQQAQRSAR